MICFQLHNYCLILLCSLILYVSIILCYLNFQIYVSYFTVFITVNRIMEFWIHPKKNILSETGCRITIHMRNAGFLQIQLHSFFMVTTRYIFVFHSNLLLKLNLTTNVSATTYVYSCVV